MYAIIIIVSFLILIFVLFSSQKPDTGKPDTGKTDAGGDASENGDAFAEPQFFRTEWHSESGSIWLILPPDKYKVLASNINVYEYIYDHENIAFSNRAHTELYWLERVKTFDNTHVYEITKVKGWSATRILSTYDELFYQLITPRHVTYRTEDYKYEWKVYEQDGKLYLELKKN